MLSQEQDEYLKREEELSTALPESYTEFLPAVENASPAAKVLLPEDLSDDQNKAFKQILSWYTSKTTRVFSLGGYAGTGKTSILALIAHTLCVEQKKQVAFLAPTAKAASVLRRKLDALRMSATYVGTIHGMLYSPVLDHKEELIGWSRRYFTKRVLPSGEIEFIAKIGDIPKLHLIVVDEASMVDENLENDILALGVPVLAVGDHGQLAPVQGKSTWMTWPNAKLEKIHRQAADSPVLALATFVREEGYLPPSLQTFGIPYFRELFELEEPLQADYKQYGLHEVAMVCYTNQMRGRLNASVNRHLFGADEPVPGSQIMVLKNRTPLINGQRGFVTKILKKKDIWHVASVYFPDENFNFVGPLLSSQFGLPKAPKNLEEASRQVGRTVDKMENLGVIADYGYAATCHKYQGSSAKSVFVVLEKGRRPNEYVRWLYTAITRAVDKVSFVEAM
jgi:exodeoxyribonuclease-5